VNTTDLTPTPVVADLGETQPTPEAIVAEAPQPAPTTDEPAATAAPDAPGPSAAETHAKGVGGTGVEGEEVLWEARYSLKNFLGRIIFRTLMTIAWFALAVYTWEYNHTGLSFITIVLGVVLVFVWGMLTYRMLLARYGHEYRLTNRRLFVTTGLFRRRRDQMELLRVKDVFTRHTLLEGMLSLGTVVVVSNEASLPTFYLAGVDDPQRVMDLVWHCARAEREGKSVQVDNI